MGEKILTGIPISKGIAIGKAHKLNLGNTNSTLQNTGITNYKEEFTRFSNAITELIDESKLLIEKYSHKGKIKSILESEIMFFEDAELSKAVETLINEGKSAEVAVNQFLDGYLSLVGSNNSFSTSVRLDDIGFVKQKILQKLEDKSDNYKPIKNKIVVASVLNSNEVLKIYENGSPGFATEFGSNLSHSSIISRSLDIPAVFGVGNLFNEVENGDTIIIDGIYGEVIINPTNKTITKYRAKSKEFELEVHSKLDVKNKNIKNSKGKRIKFYSNISNILDLENTLANGADGVGLVRTENLVENVEDILDEDLQYELYNKIAESIYPKPVIFRLFDFGFDKLNLNSEQENNPALGLRGIRYLMKNNNVLDTQLRALIRASKNGNLKILIPMVTKLSEIVEVKKLAKKISLELDIYCPKIGTMIETPVAAHLSKDICKISDFINLGTNDLLQYYYVADRNNTLVNHYLNYLDKAFLSVLSKIRKDCEATEKELVICGQMSSDEASFMALFKKGFTNFSIVPTRIKPLKKLLIK